MIEADLTARLRAWLRATVDDPAVEALGARPIAIGWATVDLDRAIDQVGRALGVAPDRWADAPGSPLLGAECRIATDALGSGLALVLLEPVTEGRLAATLARHDEGPAATWLVAMTGGGAAAHAASTTEPGAPAHPADEHAGPFGPERLLPGPSHGPHRLVVRLAGTIRP